MSDPDNAFAPGVGEPARGAPGPAATEPAEDTEALLLDVIRDVRDLLAHVLARLDALAAASAEAAASAAPAAPAANVQALDAKVGELGAAMGSIATMLESIDMAVHAAPAEAGLAAPTGAALVERVAAAGGSVGINALLHARVEAIEQHVEVSSAELKKLTAQLDHIEDGIGYLAAALLGGG